MDGEAQQGGVELGRLQQQQQQRQQLAVTRLVLLWQQVGVGQNIIVSISPGT